MKVENHQGKLNLNNFHGMKLYQNVTINLQKEQFQCAENFKKETPLEEGSTI